MIQCSAGSRKGSASVSGATGSSEIKIKKHDKKSSFTAWSDEEKELYQNFITVSCPAASMGGIDEPVSRPITALDDFMQSTKFAARLVLVSRPDYGYVMIFDI